MPRLSSALATPPGEKSGLNVKYIGTPDEKNIPDHTEQKDIIMKMKMSKSDPNSAIWIHDTPEDIEKKINQAFCPEREIHFNPILNWIGHLLFWNRENQPFHIERKKEHGGDIEFTTYQDLEKAYAEGDVHPMDLKTAATKELTQLLEPARDPATRKGPDTNTVHAR